MELVKKIRMPLDIAMTVLSVILMGGMVLFPKNEIHQILGMVLIALWTVHLILNRRWYGSLFRRKYTAYGIMQIMILSRHLSVGFLNAAVFTRYHFSLQSEYCL